MSGIDPARGMATAPIMLSGNLGANLMLVHIFRGPGRVFGFTEDATGANLEDIEKHGFHITDAHVRITESVI